MSKELTKYEDVEAFNPITKEIEIIKLEVPEKKTPEEMAAATKAELAKHGLEPLQKVIVEDPLSGEKKMITLNRAGHNETRLIQLLADPDLTRDRKDFELSMYMYERGSHSMSMIGDLMRYKGAHTKETRIFKSQIRFDFEAFVNGFATYLQDREKISASILGIDIRAERAEFLSFVAERKEQDEKDKVQERKAYTYLDYYAYKNNIATSVLMITDRVLCNQIMLAMHDADEADLMVKRMRAMAEAREQEKGKGIYLSASNKPYLMTDPDLDDIIKKDREASAEAQKDNE